MSIYVSIKSNYLHKHALFSSILQIYEKLKTVTKLSLKFCINPVNIKKMHCGSRLLGMHIFLSKNSKANNNNLLCFDGKDLHF